MEVLRIKALFLDFYGTLVHEDDEIIPLICQEIQESSSEVCEVNEIGKYWWDVFSDMFRNSYGDTFQLQRELGVHSLTEAISRFKGNCDARIIIQKQFDHWSKPRIYEDTLPFLNGLREQGYRLYILSNIDTADIEAAVTHHGIEVDGILTSEDVQAYKPRPEIFMEALDRYHLSTDEVIHVGDSYSSDVCGANHAGIKSIWLNRHNKKLPAGPEPDYICRDLNEVKLLISNTG